jgi:hypothetical protein
MSDQIMRLAKEAGFLDGDLELFPETIERFAELVRQDERKKCARLCDDLAEGLVGDDFDGAWGAGYCARAIEARGNNEQD